MTRRAKCTTSSTIHDLSIVFEADIRVNLSFFSDVFLPELAVVFDARADTAIVELILGHLGAMEMGKGSLFFDSRWAEWIRNDGGGNEGEVRVCPFLKHDEILKKWSH